MKTLYNEIELEQQKEIEQLEIELAQYAAEYTGIKNHPASALVKANLLRLAEYLLYGAAAISFISFVWIETVDLNFWSDMIDHGTNLSPLGAVVITANSFAWKIITGSSFGMSLVLRWLVGHIRNKNQVVEEQSNLIKNMLNKMGTNLYKIKESRKHFEALNPETQKVAGMGVV